MKLLFIYLRKDIFHPRIKASIMNIDLTGKKALVCGSSQGIGKASAIALAQQGADIVLMARNQDSLTAVLAELDTTHNQQHEILIADFRDPDQVKDQITAFSARNVTHILINNTGGPPAGDAIHAKPEEFLAAFNAHLICNHHLAHALVPAMKQARYGRIVNIISTSVKVPIPGLGVSNTIRGAVANWAKTLSRELGPFGITVNNVLPGLTWTGRLESLIAVRAEKAGVSPEEQAENMKAGIPVRRFADASEVANAVAFLASPAAAYINGINLPVDGGNTPSL